MKKTNTLFLALLLIVYFLTFRVLFLKVNPVFGDAPNFSSNLINTYLSEPQVWRGRIENFGGISVGDMALSNIMFFYAALHKIFDFDSQILLKIVFYFPATIFSLVSAYLLAGIFIKNKISKLIVSFFYVFNTYFLLLIDGGQVGVALGYSLAPLVLKNLFGVFKRFTVVNFLYTLILFFVLSNIEVRFAAIIFIAFLAFILTESFTNNKFHLKKLLFLIPLIPICILLNFSWIYPLIGNGGQLTRVYSDFNFTNFNNAIFLFQPHWFLNQFGHTFPIPVHFIFLPILIFSSIVINPNKMTYNLLSVFLIFSFFVKGSSEPFGFVYQWLIDNVPYLNIFRDSSKFYIVTILFGAVLIGRNLETVRRLKPKLFIYTALLVFTYLTLLIYPAVSGKMTGVLGVNRYVTSEYDYINELINKNQTSRYLFFKSRPPFVRETYPSDILNADSLYKIRPFATLIEGTYDKFYFLWNPFFPKLLDLAGIEYIFFTPDLSKKIYTEKDVLERDSFVASVSAQFKNERLESLSFPAFKTGDLTPRVFSAKKVLLVIGPDDIYEKLFASNNTRMSQIPLIFLDDGSWKTDNLINIGKNDLDILFNQKSEKDILYRSIEGTVFNADQSFKKNWGEKHEVVEWRDEARKGGILTHDFDLGSGVLFSNIPGEMVEFKFDQEKNDEVSFVLRVLGKNSNVSLSLDGNKIAQINIKDSVNFNYYPTDKIKLDKGFHKLSVVNENGFTMLNIIKIYNQEEYKKASRFTSDLLKKFKRTSLNTISRDNLRTIEFDQISETEYKVGKINAPWLFLSENYNIGWKFGNAYHYPAYSFINSFYLGSSQNVSKIQFDPQNNFSLGLKVSLVSGLVIVIISCVGLMNRRKIEKLFN